MASFMKDFEHLEIQLEEIISATNNFDVSKVIGVGGFGKVYAAELSHSQSEEKSLVAIKRLDHRYDDPGLRARVWWKPRSLVKFCLSHLDATIKICLDAAKGLSFLHDPNGTQQRVLHCDVKSANILLDENLNAKVSDFGLSKMGSADQQYSVIVTNVVLCGKQCIESRNGQLNVYVPFWKKTYEDENLEGIVLQDLKKQIDAGPSVEERANLFLEAQDRIRKRAFFKRA
ncbi:kinase-like domain, phloem protein 2-like protein [Tanacetum coccineum]